MSDSVPTLVSLRSETAIRRRSLRWVRIGAGLLLALVLMALTLFAMTSFSRAAPLAIRTPSLTVEGDPPGGTSAFRPELFAHPDVSATFIITLTNAAGLNEITATQGYIQATINPSTTLFDSPDTYVSSVVGDNTLVTWTVAPPDIPIGGSVAVTLYAWLDPAQDNLLGTEMEFLFDGFLKGEDDTSDDARQQKAYYVVGPFIDPVIDTSVDITGNTPITQVVAGELVTATVTFTIPKYTLAYTATPRILFQDGLSPTVASGDTPWVTTTTDLDWDDAIDQGYMLEFAPFSATNELSDTARTFTVTAVALQDYPIQGGTIPHDTPLIIQSLLRWCETPGCVLDERGDYVWHTDDEYAVNFLRPEVQPQINYSYPDSPGIGQGGGQVQFAISNTNTLGHPPAYDMVMTFTLDTGLTFSAASPGCAGGAIVRCERTEELMPGDTWPVTVTADLPVTLTVGQIYTVSALVQQETFSGFHAYEGIYIDQTDVITFMPGLSEQGLFKSAAPGTATIGDVVDYTIVFTQGANSKLISPRFVDTLPEGYHYVSPTLNVQGATLVGVPYTQATTTQQEQLIWSLDDISQSVQTRITMTFEALLNGQNTAGTDVYTETLDDTEDTFNNVRLYAEASGGEQLLKEVDGGLVGVQQSLLRINRFERSDTNTLEIGAGSTDFQLDVRNQGDATAYDVIVCDQLPTGILYDQDVTGSDGLAADPKPTSGDTGEICWGFDQITPGDTKSILYRVRAYDAVTPGEPLRNQATAKEYSSQLGTVAGERLYHLLQVVQDYANTSVWCDDNCPYAVLGLEMLKSAEPDPAFPGQLLTYTLAYTDTSTLYNYGDLIITDTYDTNLTYEQAVPAPVNETTNPLTWTIGSVPDSSRQEITLVMRVISPATGLTSVTNRMQWHSTASSSSGQQPPLEQVLTTALSVPGPDVQFTDPVTIYPGSLLTYTVVYSNNGTDASDVALTFDYDPNLTYGGKVSGDAIEMSPTRFEDTLGAGMTNTLQVSLTVNMPLPYDLPQIVSQVTIESLGAAPVTDTLALDLLRPVLQLVKTGPAQPAGVGSDMDYTIQVTNTGSYTATGLLLTDTWDENSSYNTVANNATGWTDHGTYASYSVSQLGIGESTSLIPFSVIVEKEVLFYTNTVQLATDQTTVQSDDAIVWQWSIETTKSAYPDPAFPGRVLTYTIRYTNTGGAVTNVSITDTLPTDFSYIGQDIPSPSTNGCQTGWSFQAPAGGADNDAVWTCPSMLASAQGTLRIWGMIAESADGTHVQNETASNGDGIPYRPIYEPLSTRVARPRLSIAKSDADIGPVAPGGRITYTLTYSNYSHGQAGTDPAYNVVITDQLPAQVSFVSCDPTCSESGGLVTWNVGTVPTGTAGVRQATLVVDVKADTHGMTVTNAGFNLWSDRLPPDETEVGPAVHTKILDPHLTLRKTSDPAEVVRDVSDPITYTIAYINDGGGTLTNVVITDALPNQVVFSSASPNCGHNGVNPGGVVTCTVGSLIRGASGSVQIKMTNAASEEGTEITNQAQGDSDQTESVDSNLSRMWYFSNCVPVLYTDFTSNSPVALGQVMSFTAVLTPTVADTPVTYNWDFGGIGTGGNTDGPTPTFEYDDVGTYTVTLEVDNDCGTYPAVQASHSVVVTAGVGAPDIVVDPASFNVTLAQGATTQRTLIIENAGDADLQLNSMTESPDAPWLNDDFVAGAVAAGETATVTLTFDAGTLDANTYTTTLQIDSNDQPVDVPVTLVVGEFRIYLPLVLKSH